MATIEIPPIDYAPEITGYAEPWIVSPGDTVAIKVSSTEPEYTYRTFRVIQGVDVENSPQKKLEEIKIQGGTRKGRYQVARIGSYGLVKNLQIPYENGIEVFLYFQPWLPQAGHFQSVISTLNTDTKSGFAVIINAEGEVELWIGTKKEVESIKTQFKPAKRRWVEMSLKLKDKSVSAELKSLPHIAEKSVPGVKLELQLKSPAEPSHSDLMFGGTYAETFTHSAPRVTNFFNGRIDSPTIKTIDNSNTLVKYDFSLNISEDSIKDVSGHNHHGILINAPTRAVTGHDWDGNEVDWSRAKSGYGAIHFHEDDIDDAAWDTDFEITLPKDVKSGIYSVEVKSTNGKTSDMITFFVTAAKTPPTPGKVAIVLSTFTYLAYANEQLFDKTRTSAIDVGPNFDRSSFYQSEDFSRLQRRRDVGISNYDVHLDNSGTIYSSAKRPILNLRPGYVMWAFRRPRELSADSMMIGYLEKEDIPYDVLTDHDLHVHGADILGPYNTVITGSHPEYPSTQSYTAYEQYAKQGGNIMYLGGNGFYWVSATDLARPWRLEVRRGDQGVRTYILPGGERFTSLTGVQGGLWRSRGRSSHHLFGIAFCAEGVAPGVPYKRTDASYNANLQWMFKDIPDNELIGEHGLGGGASGDEIDSYDTLQGSPTNAIIIATSTGHPDDFGIAPECTTFPITGTLGTQTNEIRSDMIYYDTDAGGAVFSVGSINWYCSLGWKAYENNVAKLTGNVLREFLRRGGERTRN